MSIRTAVQSLVTPIVVTAFLAAGGAAVAEEAAKPAAAPDPQAEAQAAFAAADRAAQTGPIDVKLRDQALFQLPAGFRFIPAGESARLLQAMGNTTGPSLLGMVVPGPDQGDAGWIVVMEYVEAGYIKDDDAREWNADELLQNLKDGTEATNEERRKRGIGEMQVLGWIEPPRYDAAAHRLVWSASTKDKADPGTAPHGVNYNTYALGREGYVSLNLVTDYATIEKEKPVAQQLLAALKFNDGKKYSDFNSSTDKVAEYGLAALIGGIAAKKLGLFAIIAAFVLKFAKVIGVAALGLGGLGAKWFSSRRKKNEPDA
ncbi:MAG: DUF2167 domain-containing protein [Burkholderiales bacterium]